jgi:phytoene synthase
MAFEVARARQYFRRAEGLLPHLSPESRRCPALLAEFYQAILDRIERAGYDVFRRRPRLSVIQKLSIAGASLLRARP